MFNVTCITIKQQTKNMITPLNTINTIAQSLDGLYVTSITILAPSPNVPIQATIRIAPYNTITNYIARNLEQSIRFTDVVSSSIQYPVLGNALSIIEDAVQQLVVSQSLFTTPTNNTYTTGSIISGSN